jgi:serine/threonine protein kinase/Tfp pilus assembly protein PilF
MASLSQPAKNSPPVHSTDGGPSALGPPPFPAELLEALPRTAVVAAEMPSASIEVGPGVVLGSFPDLELPTIPGYELLGELGNGGMGVVYKARHLGLNRVVALKTIRAGSQASKKDRARFASEARAVARLGHPNIVQIFDVGEHEGHAYLSLEFVDGGSLADQLTGQPFPAEVVAPLVECLARAIHFAHQRGIIHRDLKPANILLVSGGVVKDPKDTRDDKDYTTHHSPLTSHDSPLTTHQPKITDFGLAKQLDSNEDYTRSGTIVGTPSYMAPEQAMARNDEIGLATDIHALGVMLYELLTGKRPYRGETTVDLQMRIATQDPVPPSRLCSHLPRDLETICLRCLQKKPARRYATAEALADDLRRFQAREAIQARPVRRWERGLRWVRRRPAVAGLLALSLLLALALLSGAAVFQYRQHRRHEHTRATLTDVLQRSRRAIQEGHYDRACTLLGSIQPQMPGGTAVAGLLAERDRLLAEAEGLLKQQASLKRFAALHEETLFLATLPSEDGAAGSLSALREKVRAAFDEVGMSVEEDREGKQAGDFAPGQQTRIRQGCYELLLVLAEAEARVRPSDSDRVKQRRARSGLKILDRAGQLGVRTHAFHLRRARYWTQAGAPHLARREQELAAAIPPASAFDHYLLGEERYQQRDTKGALSAFLEALQQQPSHFWARYFLALCYVHQREYDRARNSLIDCEAQHNKVPWIYLLRGFVRGQLQEFNLAEKDLDTAWGLLQKHPSAQALYGLYNNRGYARIQKKDFARGEKDLREAIKLFPMRFQAHAMLAEALRRQHKEDVALPHVEQAIRLASPMVAARELDAGPLVSLYRLRAQLALARKDPAQALKALDGIVALKPPRADLVRTHIERGDLLLRGRRFTEALAAYEDALKHDPDNALAQRWRAQALLRLQRYAEAEQAYTTHIKGKGTAPPEVYQERALARVQLGKQEEALDDCTRVLVTRPDSIPVRLLRAQTYLRCEANLLAVRDFTEVLKRDKQNATAHVGRGLARFKLGEYSLALEDADHAASLPTVTSQACCQAARLYALAAAQQSTLTRPSPALLRRYQERAVQLLRQTLELVPVEQRTAFWREKVKSERAFVAIERTAGFILLERQLSPPRPKPSAGDSVGR